MKFHSIIALFFALILSSCTERPPKPKPFLSEKQMVELFTELHLIEAGLQQTQNSNNYNLDSARLHTVAAYNELFKKYGLKQESFEANLHYRTYYSRDLARIYTRVHENLQQMDEQRKREQLEQQLERLERIEQEEQEEQEG